jgi:hypothetical protein
MQIVTAGRGHDFDLLLARLNRASVDKHFDAYSDVDWDAPEMAIEEDDPRLERPDDPLAHTAWYAEQPPATRARIGLFRVVASAKTGAHFENLLQRGLLTRAMRLPDGSPEFRYAHHEIVEESQHSMMFQELVARSGFRVRGMPTALRLVSEIAIPPMSVRLPMLFFVVALGGEDPADHVQRSWLRAGGLHPLIERIMRIHVTEEARHLSYARRSLIDGAPRLGRLRRNALAIAAPLLLALEARLILVPPADIRRECGVPRRVVRQAFRSPQGRQLLRDSLARTRQVLREAGLMTRSGRATWKLLGIWDHDVSTATAPVAE